MENKSIYLLRHGKAEWGKPAANDIDRDLLEEGIQRTEQVANYLKDINTKIDKIISSPAKRALRTATIIKNALNLPEIVIDDRLYPCSEESIFKTIIEQKDSINSILIVGHNPGLTYFAAEYIDPDIDNMPTAGVVSCKYYTKSWSEFIMVDKKLNFVLSPKKM